MGIFSFRYTFVVASIGGIDPWGKKAEIVIATLKHSCEVSRNCKCDEDIYDQSYLVSFNRLMNAIFLTSSFMASRRPFGVTAAGCYSITERLRVNSRQYMGVIAMFSIVINNYPAKSYGISPVINYRLIFTFIGQNSSRGTKSDDGDQTIYPVRFDIRRAILWRSAKQTDNHLFSSIF